MATEEHEVVNYRGRDVCSCGDFNCASLDIRPPKLQQSLRYPQEQAAVLAAYPSQRWQSKVSKMDDIQLIAVYLRLKTQQKV